jgi:hypothetical protein
MPAKSGSPCYIGGLDRQSLFRGCDRIIPIQAGNERRANFSGANCFAFVMVSAISEAEFIHLPYHMERAAFAFRLTLRQEAEV